MRYWWNEHNGRKAVLFGVPASLAICAGALGQVCVHATETAHLIPGTASTLDYSGYALAVASGPDGEVLAIANRDDDNAKGLDAGSVSIFARMPGTTSWTEEATLLAPDGAAGDLFGVSVATKRIGSLCIVAIGAHQHDTPGGADAGSVYVFSKPVGGTSWSHQATLTASDASSGDFFGVAVAIGSLPTTDIIAVGAHGDDGAGGFDAGSAYVFRRPTGSGSWTQVAKLVPGDLASQDNFGTAMAIEQEMLVVGAFQHDTSGNPDAGEAYVFEGDAPGSTWTQKSKLNSVSSSGSRFGRTVDVLRSPDRDTIAVGTEIVNQQPGRAYLFDRLAGGTTWTLRATLQSWNPQNTDIFGYSVALGSIDQSDVFVVGAIYEDGLGGENCGATYIYKRSFGDDGWLPSRRVEVSDSEALDIFGAVVDVAGSTVVGSAPGDATPSGGDTGSVYVIDLIDRYADCDCDQSLAIDDFICFQTFFAIGDPYADCDLDGGLTIDDFICFQTFFAIGC